MNSHQIEQNSIQIFKFCSEIFELKRIEFRSEIGMSFFYFSNLFCFQVDRSLPYANNQLDSWNSKATAH